MIFKGKALQMLKAKSVRTIMSSNSKTEKSVNLPTCVCSKDCPWNGNGCYGQKGRFEFSNVKESNLNRLALLNTNISKYFADMGIEFSKSRLGFIRIFGIGDTPDPDYMERLYDVIKNNPEINFWIASFKAKFSNYNEIVAKLNKLDNCLVRISEQNSNDHDKYDYTSSVIDPDQVDKVNKVNLCPCGVTVDNCKECGYKCWNKDIKHTYYIKH